MRILVAEDTPSSRRLLEGALTTAGYDVVTVPDGTAAWTSFESGDAPQLAVLDWEMPGLTGPQVCRKVRACGSQAYTYMLLLTSKTNIGDLVEAMEAGADDYITKPFDPAELFARLRSGRRILDLQAQLLAAREELREQATRDALTGVWNRYSILEILCRDLARAAREGGHVGIALMDLDHFKAVNDTYGHLAGDAVLQQAARRVEGAVRTYDAIGRYGGEEFLAVLPGCREADAVALAERMRHALAAEPARLEERELRMSASFGVASAPGGRFEDMIHAADEALYRAKRSGRNRVIGAESNALLLCR
jgi:diguanylate cyclase (GGDEF)-like protein